MICSVLIPSRQRINKLIRCVNSFLECADGRDFEILIRLDDDDPECGRAVETFKGATVIKTVVGKRLGYDMLNRGYFTELLKLNQSKWFWLSNDDQVLQRNDGQPGWDTQLSEFPDEGYYAQPEIHQLNQSNYFNDNRSGSPIFPRTCLQMLSIDEIPENSDYRIPERLEQELDWGCLFIKGLTVFHDRQIDHTLKSSRY